MPTEVIRKIENGPSTAFETAAIARGNARSGWKLFLCAMICAACIAPTLVSYETYFFKWDDSDYLARSILASRSFWSHDAHAMRIAVVSVHPPVMTLLGLPWGTLNTWDAAGKCFITLAALSALFAACAVFLLLRTGFNPIYLVIAGISAFLSLGPYPHVADGGHYFATGFMVDSLFAWIALAAILLIPYEARLQADFPSAARSVLRGVLWGVILATGAMTKTSFAYFIVLVVPAVFYIRLRHWGWRPALISLGSLVVWSLPLAIYWLRYGLPALKYGWAASFGHDASSYFQPLSVFLSNGLQQSPGMVVPVAFAAASCVYFLVKRQELTRNVFLLPLLIMIGYCAIGLASSNRETRFLLLGVLAPPFLFGLLMSGKSYVFTRSSAVGAAGVVFLGLTLAGVPMAHRASKQSIAEPEEVLRVAAATNSKNVLLATDSSSLNQNLLTVAQVLSSGAPVQSGTLAWRAESGVPIEDDYKTIKGADLVVFQNAEALNSDFTNVRVPQYEQYARQIAGAEPIRDADGLRFYKIPHQVAAAALP